MTDTVVYGVPGDLAGQTLRIADLMVAPHLLFFRGTPDAEQSMRDTSLDAWLKRMQARPSMQATEVERAQQVA
jgi:glutathione S-transferase